MPEKKSRHSGATAQMIFCEAAALVLPSDSLAPKALERNLSGLIQALWQITVMQGLRISFIRKFTLSCPGQ